MRWDDGDTHAVRRIFVTSDMVFSAFFDSLATDHDTVWRTVAVTSADESMGSAMGGGVYPDSSWVTIAAHPFEPSSAGPRARFVSWSDGDSNNPRRVFVVSDTSFTALFEPIVGIEGAEGVPYKVYVRQGRVAVEGVENEAVLIFDLMGRRHMVDERLPRGVYLVRIGTFTTRVVVM